MEVTNLFNATGPAETNISTGYLIGALIALLILGYLIYTLIRPEKF